MSNDININESEILESLNAKIDYDGGNYKGSGLANYVVDKSGDTMTGALRCDVKGQWQSPIHLISSEMDWAAGAARPTNIGIHYFDKNGKVGPYFLLNQSEGSTNNYFSMGNNTTNNPNFLGFDLPKASSRPSTASTATRYKPAVVIQNYLSGNSWYRVWSDGFIEQGGVLSCTGGQDRTVTFLKAFATANYTVAVNWYHSGAHNFDDILMTHTKATGSFHIYAGETGAGGAVTMNANWLAMGY
jgi:hypothetical protein